MRIPILNQLHKIHQCRIFSTGRRPRPGRNRAKTRFARTRRRRRCVGGTRYSYCDVFGCTGEFGAKAHVVAKCIISTGDLVLLYPSQIERIPLDGEHREDVHDIHNDQFQRPSGIDYLSPNWKLPKLSLHICDAKKKKRIEGTRLYTV